MSEKEISFKIDWTPEQKKAFKDITGFTELDDDYIKIEQLLNLIEKQQNELNEIKFKNQVFLKENYVSKDKIKTKIKELKEIADEDNLEEYAKIDVLKEMLEENNND